MMILPRTDLIESNSKSGATPRTTADSGES